MQGVQIKPSATNPATISEWYSNHSGVTDTTPPTVPGSYKYS
jgi:hypothetical protein